MVEAEAADSDPAFSLVDENAAIAIAIAIFDSAHAGHGRRVPSASIGMVRYDGIAAGLDRNHVERRKVKNDVFGFFCSEQSCGIPVVELSSYFRFTYRAKPGNAAPEKSCFQAPYLRCARPGQPFGHPVRTHNGERVRIASTNAYCAMRLQKYDDLTSRTNLPTSTGKQEESLMERGQSQTISLSGGKNYTEQTNK